MSMLSEIAAQPAVLERLLASNLTSMDRLGRLVEGCTHVVVAARGTSDNAARYAQYVWGARNRLVVGLTTPALFGPLQSPPSLEGALVVGISQSGESPDLVEVLSEARRQGRPTLTITNQTGSPLAEVGDVVIDLCADPERAVAATKTYSAELTAVAMASTIIAGSGRRELDSLPRQMQRALEMAEGVASAVSGLEDADRCVVVGRGFQLATVHEWALKLQELTYLLAQPYSAADFLHGPVAVVEQGFPVLVVATTGPTYRQMRDIAADMVARGAHLVTLSDVAETPGRRLEVPEIEPWLAPIVAAPALQHFSRSLAVARRLDPDAPRSLTKVTRTR